MGRSVSKHRYATDTFYTTFECEDEFEWDDFMDTVKYLLQKQFPSMDECNRWMDREDHIILENSRGEISVSEYCGLIAICIAPRDPYNSLDVNWTWQASKGFRKVLSKAFDGLRKIGTFSNGESIYERI